MQIPFIITRLFPNPTYSKVGDLKGKFILKPKQIAALEKSIKKGKQ